jgi:hypothetical protein
MEQGIQAGSSRKEDRMVMAMPKYSTNMAIIDG